MFNRFGFCLFILFSRKKARKMKNKLQFNEIFKLLTESLETGEIKKELLMAALLRIACFLFLYIAFRCAQ